MFALSPMIGLGKQFGMYLLGRLGEASTWAAIVGWVSVTYFNSSLPPNLQNTIVQFGVSAAALAAVLIKEGWRVKAEVKTEQTQTIVKATQLATETILAAKDQSNAK